MPFKTKKQRNEYMKKYYQEHPEKREAHNKKTNENNKKRRLENKLNKDAYENDKDFEPIKRYD